MHVDCTECQKAIALKPRKRSMLACKSDACDGQLGAQRGQSESGKADIEPLIRLFYLLLLLLAFGLGRFTSPLNTVFGGPDGLGFDAGAAGAAGTAAG